jgi:hypothetical protein
LERLSIPQDAGEVQARIDEDTGLNSLRCTFVFRARDPLALAGLGDGLTVAPGEDIELLTIRAYDAGALRAYLEGQGFDYVDDYTTSGLGERAHLWQRFLFRRQE